MKFHREKDSEEGHLAVILWGHINLLGPEDEWEAWGEIEPHVAGLARGKVGGQQIQAQDKKERVPFLKNSSPYLWRARGKGGVRVAPGKSPSHSVIKRSAKKARG